MPEWEVRGCLRPTHFFIFIQHFWNVYDICQLLPKIWSIGPPWRNFTLSRHVVHWQSIKHDLYDPFKFSCFFMFLLFIFELISNLSPRIHFLFFRIRVWPPASTSATSFLVVLSRIPWWPFLCQLRLRLRIRGLNCVKQVHHNKLGAHVCGHLRCVCAVFVGHLSVLVSVTCASV